MPPPQKGKAPTKGAKQILLENESTRTFYRNMSLGAAALYAVITGALYYDSLTAGVIFMNVLVVAIYLGCYHMMRYISAPRYGENMQVLDPGLDLNMEGGMGEHVKDIVILTSITHVLAVPHLFLRRFMSNSGL
ncbi:hypothetical protein NE865_01296 [Phthorimaea operculella]|nr:hypothetical protein NE865_01296 [Phthorimaea operculella]